MRKQIAIDGKTMTISVREQYAPLEKVVKMKTKYNRKTTKQQIKKQVRNHDYEQV